MKSLQRKLGCVLVAAWACTVIITAPCLGQSAYNLAALADNPAYYWTFDEAGIVNAIETLVSWPKELNRRLGNHGERLE